jgi:CTP:molybdopterin cytidylyltransferase MocA
MSVAARALLEQDAAHVIVVEFPDATVDIDTPDD